MPDFKVEFEVYCTCGHGLCNGSTGGEGPRGPKVEVEPCERCIDAARDRGYDDGYEDGSAEAEGG